ncbi:MAG: histidine kinase [Herpetosiphonaceae bacterium]|nr:MAG: histidine kinase [Herpetosiphonaceae bacterium]
MATKAGATTSDLLSWSIALATAQDESTLLERLQQALSALNVARRVQLFWLDGQPLPLLNSSFHPPPPDEALIARLREGQAVSAINPKEPITYLPMLYRELRGWLALEAPTPGSSELMPLLQQCAAALASMRPDAETDSEVRALAMLNEIGRSLNSSLELKSIIKLIEEAIAQLLQSDHFFIALYDPERRAFRMAGFIEGGVQRQIDDRWSVLEGLTGEIVRTGQPILAEDYNEICLALGVKPSVPSGLPPARAWLGVPLQAEQILGVIVVYSYEEGVRFGLRQMRLLSALADHAAAAIERARLYERTAQMARHLAAVNEIGRAMTSTLDPEQVPGLIMAHIQEILGVEEGSLLLRDEHTDELVFAYSLSPASDQLLGTRVPPTVGIANEVIRTGQSVLANDAANHPAFYGHIDERTGFTTRDLLCVPLRGRQGIQGVIEVVNRRDGESFTLEDQRLLELVADQAAIALENARLYVRTDRTLARRVQELDTRNRQLREIIRVANALMATNNLDDLLPQIAVAVRNTCGFQRVIIGLVHREPGRRPVLRRAAAAGIDPEEFARLQKATANPEAIEALLQPPYQRGHSSYFIDRQTEAYLRLWDKSDGAIPCNSEDPGPGRWHPCDMLLTVLRSSSGELMGLLSVDQPVDGMLPSSEQIQTLEIFASQASVALENAYLYEQQQLGIQSLTALNALGMAINTSLTTPEQVLRFTIGGITDTTGAIGGGVLLQEGADLRLVVRTGQLPPPCDDLVELGRQVLDTGKALLLEAPRDTLPRSIRETGGQALILSQLRGLRSTLGVIYAVYPEVLPSGREHDFLTLAASHAAEAVESMRLSQAVRQGRDRLASILASTQDGIVMFDETAHIAEANPVLGKLFTLEIPALQGATVEDFLQLCQVSAGGDPEDWNTLAAAIEAVRGKDEEEQHGRLMIHSARPRAFAWSVLPIRGSTGPRRSIILVIRDITKEVEAERLRQDLTSMIVHDLRGPVSSVLTGMEMLERGVVGELNEQQISVVDVAAKSSRKLLGMIDTLLDIHRLEEGQIQLERGQHAITELIETVCQAYTALIESRKIALKRSFDDQLPLVYADRSHAERIFQNLLDNAIKYSYRGATIEISVRRATPDLLPSGHPAGTWVRVSIRDEGPGIPLEDQERIFEKFAQIRQSRVKGTGLGLTFCRLSVEAHGGRIWMESRPGAGSMFHFTLPAGE